jgi:hypothetical protein
MMLMMTRVSQIAPITNASLAMDQRTCPAPRATRWSGGVGVVMSVLQPTQTTRRGPITDIAAYLLRHGWVDQDLAVVADVGMTPPEHAG